MNIVHAKLTEHLISFDQPDNWQHLVQGDVLFSTLGTTLASAGSKEAQYKVDYTYQFRFAQAAANNGVARYVLVSAANSSLNSFVFYSRMKAELERDVALLSFQQTGVLRPGMLDGNRTERRTGEQWALRITRWLHKLPGLSVLRPIMDSDVAKAMIQIAKTQREKLRIYSAKELFELAALGK